nr:immunoglobulin heavy chain junction region [Macaca mulatta]MOY19668.1 immunoglobulin heavy chain junction region [Macaca mulatta]
CVRDGYGMGLDYW